MSTRSDEYLVRAAMDGDVDGFVELCHRYYPSLVAVARAVLGDGHLAEDAAQEALAAACRRMGALKEPARFGAWLTTICRNRATDILRRWPKVERLGERDFPAATCDSHSGLAGDVGGDAADFDIAAVRAAMDSLSVESRELLYLRYRNELSYDAIADLLGLTVEAIHGRLRRAKRDVKTHMERTRNRDRRS